jgi:hypothetical protein
MNDTHHEDFEFNHLSSLGTVGFIVILSCGFIMNMFTFMIIILVPHLNKTAFGVMTKYVVVQDGIFSLICLIQCILNVSKNEYVGKQVLCDYQSFYSVFFILSIGLTLCLLSRQIYLQVQINKQPFTRKQIFRYHLCIWTYATAIASLAGYFLHKGQLVPSNTYCTFSMTNIYSSFVFILFAVMLIISSLTYQYIKIFLYIRKTNGNISKDNESAYSAYKYTIKKMFIFVMVFFICNFPIVMVSITETAFKMYVSPHVYLTIAYLVHLNSVFNPILYFWFNPSTRKTIFDRLKKNQVVPLKLIVAEDTINPFHIIMTPKENVCLK